MGNTNSFKNTAVGWGNDVKMIRGLYDFSEDGGATGSFDMLNAEGPMVILQSYTRIITLFTSGGSATYEIGIGADTDAILTNTAVASMTVGVIDGATASERLLWALNETLNMTIATADGTAGKLEVVLICASAE